VTRTLSYAPAPGAAPLHRMVRSQALMETRLLLRNGEQLVLAVAIPLLVLVGGVQAARWWPSATQGRSTS
jgi:ABC-2 type transport system permease protein